MNSGGEGLAFVVGHYKSGSTWLINLLSLHPEIIGLRETHCFRHAQDSESLERCSERLFRDVSWSEGGLRGLPRHRLAKLARPFRRHGQATLRWHERPTTLLDLSLGDQFAMRRALARERDADAYCRRFFGFLQEAFEPGRYLIEKSATGTFYVPMVRRVFPASRLIAVYRDGRDVVVSDRFHLKNRYGKEQDFDASVLDWRRAMEAQGEYEREHGLITLSYEGLLSDARSETRRLLTTLDLSASPEVVERMVDGSSFKFVSGRKAGQEKASTFYRKGVAGDWANHFSDEQTRRFGELAGDLLVELGYEETADPSGWQGLS